MKKLLACGLILTMLSSTGAMCFATEEVEIVNTIQVVSTEVEKETQDEKAAEKDELLNGLEEIKEDRALTWKEKASRAWEYVKDFVKRHYVAIGAVTVSTALVVLAWIFGPKLVDSIVNLFKFKEEDQVGAKKEEVGENEKELTDEDVKFFVDACFQALGSCLNRIKDEVEKGEEFFDYCVFEELDFLGDQALIDDFNALAESAKSLNDGTRQSFCNGMDQLIEKSEEKKAKLTDKERKVIAKRMSIFYRDKYNLCKESLRCGNYNDVYDATVNKLWVCFEPEHWFEDVLENIRSSSAVIYHQKDEGKTIDQCKIEELFGSIDKVVNALEAFIDKIGE